MSNARNLQRLIVAKVLCSDVYGCHGGMDQCVEKGAAGVSGCYDELVMTFTKSICHFHFKP